MNHSNKYFHFNSVFSSSERRIKSLTLKKTKIYVLNYRILCLAITELSPLRFVIVNEDININSYKVK